MKPSDSEHYEETEEFSATSDLLRRAFAAELRMVPVPRVIPMRRSFPVIAPWAWGAAAAFACAGMAWFAISPREEAGRVAVTSEETGEPSFRIELAPGPERHAEGPSGAVPVEPPPLVWTPAAPVPPLSGSSWQVGHPAMPSAAGTNLEPGGLALHPVPSGLRVVRESLQRGKIPGPESVDVAQVVSSFRYRLPELGPVRQGAGGAVAAAVTVCPWDPSRRLALVVGEASTSDMRFAVSFLPGAVAAYRRLGGGSAWTYGSPVADVLAREGWAAQAVAVYELIPKPVSGGNDVGAWMRVAMGSAHRGDSLGLLEVSEAPGLGAESGFAVAVAGAALAWSGDESARDAWEFLVAAADRAAGADAGRREWVSWMRQVPPTMALMERR